jgi:hypothetical protein
MDYASNSNKSKGDEPEVVPKNLTSIITSPSVVRKKGVGRKFKAIFFGGDFKNAARFVVSDVLLPGARDILFDVWTKGGERVMYGETRYARRSRGDYRGQVSYNAPVRRAYRPNPGMVPDQPPRFPNRLNRRESNDVLIVSREEANTVLQTLIECIDKYEMVSMADLNELIEQPSANIDHKWGWLNLNDASIRQVREGYLIELPPMEEL